MKLIIKIFILLLFAQFTFAHDNVRTHPRIMKYASELLKSKDKDKKYNELFENMGKDCAIPLKQADHDYGNSVYKTIRNTIIAGTVLEDDPVWIVVNHFYHAISQKRMHFNDELGSFIIENREAIFGTTYKIFSVYKPMATYIFSKILEFLLESKLGVSNVPDAIKKLLIDNSSNYQRALVFWKDAIEEYGKGNISAAYHNLGRVGHLSEDMACPAHVHNDLHLMLREKAQWEGVMIPEQLDDILPLSYSKKYSTLEVKEITSLKDIWGKLDNSLSYDNSLTGYSYKSACYPGELDIESQTSSGNFSRMFNVQYFSVKATDDTDLIKWYIQNDDGDEYNYYYNKGFVWFNEGMLPSIQAIFDDWWETSEYDGPKGYFYIEKSRELHPNVFYRFNPNTDSYDEVAQTSPKSTIAEFYTDIYIPPAIEYSAGLIKFFHDLVKPPPYVWAVTVYQKLASGQEKIIYDVFWENIPESDNRKLITQSIGNIEPEEKINLRFLLSFSERMDPKTIEVRLGNQDVVPTHEGYIDRIKGWYGKIDDFKIPEKPSEAKLIISGKSIFNYFDIDTKQVVEGGRELDSNPLKIARLSVEYVSDDKTEEEYEWLDYTPGEDTNHNVLKLSGKAEVIIADYEKNPFSVSISYNPEGTISEKTAIEAIDGATIGGGEFAMKDLVVSPDNLFAFGLIGKSINIFKIIETDINGTFVKKLFKLTEKDDQGNDVEKLITFENELTSIAVTPDATRLYISDTLGNIFVLNIKKLTLFEGSEGNAGKIYKQFELNQNIFNAGDYIKELKIDPAGNKLYYLIEGKAGAADEQKRRSKINTGILGAINISMKINVPLASLENNQNTKNSNENYHQQLFKVDIVLPTDSSVTAFEFLSPFSFDISPDGNFALITAEGRRMKPYGTGFGHIPANDDAVGGVLVVDLSDDVSGERIIQHIPTVLRGEKTNEIITNIVKENQVEHGVAEYYKGMTNAFSGGAIAGTFTGSPLTLALGGFFAVEADVNAYLYSVYSEIYKGFGMVQGYSKYYGSRMVGASSVAITPDGKYALVTMKDTNNVGVLVLNSNSELLGYSSINLPAFYFGGVTEQAINFYDPGFGIDESLDTYTPTDYDRLGPEKIKITGDGSFAYVGAGRGGEWEGIWLGNRFGLIDIRKLESQMMNIENPGQEALDQSLLSVFDQAQFSNLDLKHSGIIATFNEFDVDYDSYAFGTSDYSEAYNRFNEAIVLTIGDKSKLISSEGSTTKYLSDPGKSMPSYEQETEIKKFKYGFRLPPSGIGYRFNQNGNDENASNIGQQKLINFIEKLGLSWNENHCLGETGFENHAYFIASDMSQAGGLEFKNKKGEIIHNNLRNGLQVNIQYFSNDGSDNPFEFILSNNGDSPLDNSKQRDIEEFDSLATMCLLNLILDREEVEKVLIDPQPLETIREKHEIDFFGHPKITIRGAIDDLENGSRRDMDSSMLVLLSTAIQIKTGYTITLQNGEKLDIIDPLNEAGFLKPLTVAINDSNASKVKVKFDNGGGLFKLYSDEACQDEITPNTEINVEDLIKNGQDLNIYMKIFKESGTSNDITFELELLDKDSVLIDNDIYKSSALSVAIVMNETESESDDKMMPSKDSKLPTYIKLTGPAISDEIEMSINPAIGNSSIIPHISKESIYQIPGEVNFDIYSYGLENEKQKLADPGKYQLNLVLRGALIKQKEFFIDLGLPSIRPYYHFLDGTSSKLLLPTQGSIENMILFSDSIPDNRNGFDIRVFPYRGQLYLKNNIVPLIPGPGIDGVGLGISYTYYSNGKEMGWHNNFDCHLKYQTINAETDEYRFYVQVLDGRYFEFVSFRNAESKVVYEPLRDLAEVQFSTLTKEDGKYVLTARNGTKYFYLNKGDDSDPDYRLEEVRDRLGNSIKFKFENQNSQVRVYQIDEYKANSSDLSNPTSTGRSITIRYSEDESNNPITTFVDSKGQEFSVKYDSTDSADIKMSFICSDINTVYHMSNNLVKKIVTPNNEMINIEYLLDSYADPIILPNNMELPIYYVLSIEDASGKSAYERTPREIKGMESEKRKLININQLKVTDMEGRTYNYEFDDLGYLKNRVIASLDAKNTATESYEWSIETLTGPELKTYSDLNGVKYLFIYKDGNPTSQTVGITDSITTKYEYDETFDILIKMWDPMGNLTENTINSTNGLITKTTYPDQTFVEYSYNNNNKLETINDENGYSTIFRYNGYGLVEETEDPEGGVIKFVYDGNGNVTQKTDGNNNKVDYKYDFMNQLTNTTYYVSDSVYEVSISYDKNGNILTQKDEENKTTTFTYDHRNQVKTITDAMNQVITYSYDKVGNKILEKDKRGYETDFRYDFLNRLVEIEDVYTYKTIMSYIGYSGNPLISGGQFLPSGITDKNGNMSIITYDDKYRKIVQTDAEGNTTHYTYDKNSNLTDIKDALGRVVQYKYDKRNRKKETILPATDKQSSIQIKYDKAGNIIQSIDQNGYSSHIEYDKANRPVIHRNELGEIIATKYDKNGNQTQVTDARGFTTEFKYDARNRLIKTIFPSSEGEVSYLVSYNGVGNKIDETDERGNKTTYIYDNLYRLKEVKGAMGFYLEQTEYDSNNNVTLKRDALGNETKFEYDQLNRLVKQTNASLGEKQFFYDNLNNLIKSINENNSQNEYEYNKVYKLTKEANALQQVEYSYDNVYNLIKVKDPKGNITETSYDALNRPIKVTNPKNETSETKYDPVGNIIEQTDFMGNSTIFVYDKLNRLFQRTVKDNNGKQVNEQFQYDKNSNLTIYQDQNNHIYKYEYDSQNRKIKEILPSPSMGEGQVGGEIKTLYSYYPNGLIKTITTPENLKTTYEYDSLNRKISEIDNDGQRKEFEYDNAGNLKAEINEKNVRTEAFYNALNRLIKTIEDSAKLRKTTEIKYDAVGNVEEIIDANNNKTSFTYDEINRLATKTLASNETYKYTYDANSNPIEIEKPDGNKVLQSFDELNQLKNKTVGGVKYEWKRDENGRITEASNDNAIYNYVYDNLNRLIKMSVQYPTLLPGKTRHISFSYDDAGNYKQIMTYSGKLIDYEVDELNRLKSITPSPLMGAEQVGGVTFTYDAGLLTLKEYGNGITTTYSYDSMKRLTEAKAVSSDMNSVLQLQYSFDNIGNRNFERITYDRPGLDPESKVNIFKYDSLSRVTGTKYGISSLPTQTGEPTAPSFATAKGAVKTDIHNLDLEHNRKALLETDEDAVESLTYSLNPMNQYTHINGIGCEFDKNGNLTKTVNIISNPSMPLEFDVFDVKRWDLLLAIIQADPENFATKLILDILNEDDKTSILAVPDAASLTSTQQEIVVSVLNTLKNQFDFYLINQTNIDLNQSYSAKAWFDKLMIDEAFFINPETEILELKSNLTQIEENNIRRFNIKILMEVIYPNIIDFNLSPVVRKKNFTYDSENRTLSATDESSNETVSYLYGPEGKRIAKIWPDGRKEIFFYDRNWQLIEVLNESGTLLREFTYGHGIDRPISATINLTALGIDSSLLPSPLEGEGQGEGDFLTYFYYQSYNGNVLALTDVEGNVICRYKYDINGKFSILDADGNSILSFRSLIAESSESPLTDTQKAFLKLNETLFQGREFDQESLNFYYRNRFYSPELSRFTSTDPKGFVDGMNLYAFVNANVVNMVDPYGLSFKEWWDNFHPWATPANPKGNFVDLPGVKQASEYYGEFSYQFSNAVNYVAKRWIPASNRYEQKRDEAYNEVEKRLKVTGKIFKEKTIAEYKEYKHFANRSVDYFRAYSNLLCGDITDNPITNRKLDPEKFYIREATPTPYEAVKWSSEGIGQGIWDFVKIPWQIIKVVKKIYNFEKNIPISFEYQGKILKSTGKFGIDKMEYLWKYHDKAWNNYLKPFLTKGLSFYFENFPERYEHMNYRERMNLRFRLLTGLTVLNPRVGAPFENYILTKPSPLTKYIAPASTHAKASFEVCKEQLEIYKDKASGKVEDKYYDIFSYIEDLLKE